MSGLGSAPVPPIAPDDHLLGATGRGTGEVAIVYADYECPYCAALHARLVAGHRAWAFRHFPVRSKHPRAWAAACAVEAAALQGAFEPMHMALYGDQARLDDPHLWERAERLGLDVARFDADRRSEPVLQRVRRDFESGIRAGVVTTPTLFEHGRIHAIAPPDT
ncbi:MAG TPA: DsbA family protein [Conexibacter sp.]|nr:DsbA family protein [Conexibacter sp.]